MKKVYLAGSLALFSLVSMHSVNASGYDIYVNQSSTSNIEDGSQENPFKTITAATTLAESKPSDQRKIYIADGTYSENVSLNESMSIIGQSKEGTIINGYSHHHAVDIKKTSTLSNLTVSEGYSGIYIAAGAGAYIENCKILQTQKMGVEIAKSTTSDFEKVTIKNCSIANGQGKGFYINKRKISVEKNNVEKNKEEGVDIRAGVKGSVKNNTISKNGESGIELIIGSSNLKISGNKIKSNEASGIAHQFYNDSKKLGKITLEKNTIKGNQNYGLQCTAPSGGDEPKNYWQKSINLAKNIFSGNDKSFAKRCGFQLAIKK